MKLFSGKKNTEKTRGVRRGRRRSDTRGVITALVVLILIPSVVFTGFMVDLARLKLYGNQAVMTADNWGESILTVYNNTLKDLYGLFAVSDNEEGKAAIEALQAYMESSFKPNSSTVSWGHLTEVQGALGLDTEYSGFMPYQNAEITLSSSYIGSSALSEKAVISTQIGDFMRFRVAQTLLDDGSELVEVLDTLTSMEETSHAIDKKNDFDAALEKVIEAMRAYYNCLKNFQEYQYNRIYNNTNGFLQAIARYEPRAYSDMMAIGNSESMQLYISYIQNKDAINAALNRQKNLKEGESLTPTEESMIALYERYLADPNADYSALKSRFDSIISTFKSYYDDNPIDFGNFDSLTSSLAFLASEVERTYGDLQTATAELQKAIDAGKVNGSLRDGMQQDINEINEVFKTSSGFSASCFIECSDHLWGQRSFNKTQKNIADSAVALLEDMRDAYLSDGTLTDNNVTLPNIDMSCQTFNTNTTTFQFFDYSDFYTIPKFKKLYDSLKGMFEGEGDEDAAEETKKDAEAKTEEAAKQLNETEASGARDIPASIDIGKSGEFDPGDFSIVRLVDTAVSIFDANSITEGANDLLLKLYTILYDTNMFSSRVTNVDTSKGIDSGEDASLKQEEKAVSLTGYRLCREINYLYGAEQEYIFGGYKDSDSNLNEARNKILAFRAIVNFTATYSVDAINAPIKTAAAAAKVVNPVLGIAVEAALRIAVTTMETVADWNELKAGRGIVLIKESVDDLTAWESLKGLLPDAKGDSTVSQKKKFGYSTYLTVMMIFMNTDEDIAERTGDLISLNVSCVEKGLDANGTLSALTLDMKKAYTAVTTTCAVDLDFVVMPQRMAEMLLGGTSTVLDGIRNRSFRFSVTRGY